MLKNVQHCKPSYGWVDTINVAMLNVMFLCKSEADR